MASSKKTPDPAAAALLATEEALNLSAAQVSSKPAKGSPGTGAAKTKEHSLRGFRRLKSNPLTMADLVEDEKPTTEAVELERVADLLGGTRVFQRKLKGPLDAHEVLLEGLPGKALSTLVDNLKIQKAAVFEKAIGMSLRTFQRRKGAPSKPLSQEQSGRIWKFAEILAKATAVLGSQEEAEKWLDRPALGLNQRRPIDLLATPAGVELIEDFLERLEYGVYV
jgi:putative toxin-antitoxin system antitoxin component (TIGR02293 family)